MKRKEGDVVGKWTLVRFLGGGGNADVWRAKYGRASVALKLLHRTDPEGYARFRREVEICERTDPAEVAILPVLDSHLPENPRRNRPWFAMPVAETATKALAGRALDDKVATVRDIAMTLAHLLESEGINHRDVKPENFYVWKGRAVIGDFGLAKRPEDPTLTTKVIGPYHHLPDEAFHDPNPDRELIDVYCLANSLWRLALGEEYPPRGQIRATDARSLSFLLADEPYVGRLAGLIEGATATTPNRRRTVDAFAGQLTNWLSSRMSVDRFEAEFEAAETRRLALLRWLVDYVRREPVFDNLFFTASDDEPESLPPVPGFTYEEAARCLVDLMSDALVGGRRDEHPTAPRYFSNFYPSRQALRQLGEYEVVQAQSTGLLYAFQDPADLELPPTTDVVAIRGDITLTPAEAYFQIRFLQEHGWLQYTTLAEGGGSLSLMNVHTTSAGQRWLYENRMRRAGG